MTTLISLTIAILCSLTAAAAYEDDKLWLSGFNSALALILTGHVIIDAAFYITSP
jgi:hypothetical protein